MINAFLNAQLWWPLRGCVCAQLLSPVWLFVTPWTCSLPRSSLHGIFQARILEWVAISSSRPSPFLRLPTQNKVQMKLLSSLRIVVILLGSQILTDDVMTQKKMQNRQPIISFLWFVTLEATGLRPAAFWPWLCRALWKQCGWVSPSVFYGRVNKPFHHLVLEKCMPLF